MSIIEAVVDAPSQRGVSPFLQHSGGENLVGPWAPFTGDQNPEHFDTPSVWVP